MDGIPDFVPVILRHTEVLKLMLLYVYIVMFLFILLKLNIGSRRHSISSDSVGDLTVPTLRPVYFLLQDTVRSWVYIYSFFWSLVKKSQGLWRERLTWIIKKYLNFVFSSEIKLSLLVKREVPHTIWECITSSGILEVGSNDGQWRKLLLSAPSQHRITPQGCC